MPYIKPPPVPKKRSNRKLNIDWTNREEINKYHREYMKKNRDMFRPENPDYGKSIKSMHKARFGENREKVLKRDNHTCRVCGMTDKQHKAKWDRHITIDHIDGFGRYSKKPNNSMSNMWALCLACHGRRDSLRYRITQGSVLSKELMKTLKL